MGGDPYSQFPESDWSELQGPIAQIWQRGEIGRQAKQSAGNGFEMGVHPELSSSLSDFFVPSTNIPSPGDFVFGHRVPDAEPHFDRLLDA